MHEEVAQLQRLVRELRSQLEDLRRRIPPPATEQGSGSSETCSTSSPSTVGSSGEGLEAANTATWTGGAAMDLWVTSRVGYFHAGSSTLYGYARKLSFNSCGKLTAVSAETRYEIDVPEVC